MENTIGSELVYIDNLSEFDFSANPHGVTHILCTGGSMCFMIDYIRYNISEKDYVILTAGVFPSDFILSENCKYIAISFPDSLLDREAFKNNYGVIGHFSLLQNPVIKLSEEEYHSCLQDLVRLKDKLGKSHLFKDEIIGTLLKAHALDLYDIHARRRPEFIEGGRPAILLQNFIGILLEGQFKEHRSIEYYASQLCVNPHYITEVCRRFTRQPASYWIDRFVNGNTYMSGG